MEDDIRSMLVRLREETVSIVSNDSLLVGTGGILLFQILIDAYTGKDSEDIENKLQSLAEQCFEIEDCEFCTGLSGLHWLFSFLHKRKFIDNDFLNLLKTNDYKLIARHKLLLEDNNFDFLYGALGISYYFLYSDERKFYSQIKNTISSISRFMENEVSMFPDRSSFEFNFRRTELGMAHGLTSFLKYCIECYKKGIESKRIIVLAKKIVDYFISNINTDIQYSCYPDYIIFGEKLNRRSRLGWCFGDLPIGYILLQYSVVFEDMEVNSFALRILGHTTNRREAKDTGIIDAGMCHGSAGVAHIYNKVWQITKDDIYKKMSRYWLQKTLEFSKYSDGIAGFKQYDAIEKRFKNAHSLLEGSSGIGMVLLSYLSNDFDWDYCLMLN